MQYNRDMDPLLRCSPVSQVSATLCCKAGANSEELEVILVKEVRFVYSANVAIDSPSNALGYRILARGKGRNEARLSRLWLKSRTAELGPCSRHC